MTKIVLGIAAAGLAGWQVIALWRGHQPISHAMADKTSKYPIILLLLGLLLGHWFWPQRSEKHEH